MTAPAALSPAPQFTPEYWRKVPRSMVAAEIERITNADDEFVEIVFKDGNSLHREKGEIQQLLTPNLVVNVEVIRNPQGTLVTGLHVPEVGWAFRMTADDLAQYTQKLAEAVRQQEELQRRQVHEVMARLIAVYLTERAGADQPIEVDGRMVIDHSTINTNIDLLDMGSALVDTMQELNNRGMQL